MTTKLFYRDRDGEVREYNVTCIEELFEMYEESCAEDSPCYFLDAELTKPIDEACFGYLCISQNYLDAYERDDLFLPCLLEHVENFDEVETDYIELDAEKFEHFRDTTHWMHLNQYMRERCRKPRYTDYHQLWAGI